MYAYLFSSCLIVAAWILGLKLELFASLIALSFGVSDSYLNLGGFLHVIVMLLFKMLNYLIIYLL